MQNLSASTAQQTEIMIMRLKHVVLLVVCLSLQACSQPEWTWETVEATGAPTARHEASFIEHKGKLYLIGGRRINPTDVFDPATQTWSKKSAPPLEIHHFQAVSVNDAVYIIGAMTGPYPNEKPLDRVLVYRPQTDTYEFSHEIPEHRRRGGAGAVVYNGKVYLVGGITNGHVDGYQSWLDEYDPKTGEWRVLPNAEFARDHVQAAVLKDKLYVFGGRTSRQRTDEVMSLLTEYGEVFDFQSGQWQAVTKKLSLPNTRAGNMLAVWGDEIIVGGGETHRQVPAHAEIDVYNTATGLWSRWPDNIEGRHGTGFVIVGDYLYTASGSGNRGGGPELTSIERLKLPSSTVSQSELPPDETPVHQLWHTVSLSFEGPETSETAEVNPFTDYRLDVVFTNPLSRQTVRGFYAADGNAADSGASSGNIWTVRFSPHIQGKWTYKASLRKGKDIALADDSTAGETISLSNASGEFFVAPSDKDATDFRAHGRLGVDRAYFRFTDSGQFWVKAGANSPENLLGFVDFDGTYRVSDNAREGEADSGSELHTFAPHSDDWRSGDPTWRDGKGKNLIGAMNYLAGKGMNSVYFLTMNINGDGKDVWPYINHEDFSRFDVSKLEQWERLFAHMQSLGIMLHVVIQETENERLLDDGDVGPQRKLYLNELIARFAHHNALVWNLGEENGPTDWSPHAQSDEQRKAMATYLKQADSYKHPVLLHTHSTPEDKDHILTPQLGHEPLDGLSFQVHEREQVHDEVIRWRKLSREAGNEWLITMDEIGQWHTAVLPDSLDPNHDTIRRYALWGSLMAGAAGVEWYFGAKYPANDLTSEDWRLRDRLWTLSNHARDFFQRHVPFWAMAPADELIDQEGAYVLAKPGDVYVVYLPTKQTATLDLSGAEGQFQIDWFDPLNGGDLQAGGFKRVHGGSSISLGGPPNAEEQDWVVLVRRLVSDKAE